MKIRLRSLLTQFTLRDLFWLILLVAVVSYASREMRELKTEVAHKKAEYDQLIAEQVKLTKHMEDGLTILDNWNKQHGNPPSGYVQALERANGGWGAGSRVPVGSPVNAK